MALATSLMIGAFGANPALARDNRGDDHRGSQQHQSNNNGHAKYDHSGRSDNRRVENRRQERRWAVGRPLPRDLRASHYSAWKRRGLSRPPRGHYYARVGDDVLLLRLRDGAVIRFAFHL